MSVKRIGKDWQSLPQKTTWTQYAATLTGSVANPTGTSLGRASAESNVYRRHGDLVICRYKFSCSYLDYIGSGYWQVSLPFEPVTPVSGEISIGQWFFYTPGTTSMFGDVLLNPGDTTKISRLGCPIAPNAGGANEMYYLGDRGSSSLTIDLLPLSEFGFTLDVEFFYEAKNG